MRECDVQAVLRRRLCEWFDTPLGRSLQATEAHRLRAVLPHLYGTVALQLGHIGRHDLMEGVVAPTRILLDVPDTHGFNNVAPVHGVADALPFETRSVDLVLLPHTLEFSPDPHQVLREVQRVLAPEGHVVILGFNPFSLWGLWRLFAHKHGRAPWCGQFLHLARVKDWLALLEFSPTQGKMLYYRPPLTNERVMERLFLLEKAGDRWWPMAAGVYLLVAKKRVPGMTALRPVWKTQRTPVTAVIRPVARGLRRHG